MIFQCACVGAVSEVDFLFFFYIGADSSILWYVLSLLINLTGLF